MNIFYLDPDLDTSASYLCDKHIVKMPTESGQMMSDVLRRHGLEAPYKKANPNHPCTKWAGDHELNYRFLYNYTISMCREYTRRYGKVHKIEQMINEGIFPDSISIEEVPTRTPMPNCTSIKEYPPYLNLVDLYRLYYIRDKKPFIDFKYYRGEKEEPWFMGDRFYLAQLEAIGTCPGKEKPTRRKSSNKPNKADLVSQIDINGIDKLTIPDLQKLSFVLENVSLEIKVPEGRLKAPYVDICKEHISADINWTKLTVATLKSLLESVNANT